MSISPQTLNCICYSAIIEGERNRCGFIPVTLVIKENFQFGDFGSVSAPPLCYQTFSLGANHFSNPLDAAQIQKVFEDERTNVFEEVLVPEILNSPWNSHGE